MKQRIITGLLFGIVFLGILFFEGMPFIVFLEFIIGVSIYELFTIMKQKSAKNIAIGIIGIFYILIGFYTFGQIRLEKGFAYVLFIVVIIWATDSGAYFIGKKIGKHKLAPKVSPNKTIEGTIGGIATAIVTAMIFQIVYPVTDKMVEAILFAALISIAGQLGDLLESAFKRAYKVKDSGNILPGHGGALDRFDSLMFVFFLLQFVPYFS